MGSNFLATHDDLSLANAVKEGNQQSLELVYDRYAPALSGIIHRIANTEKQADDILTITFMKIWNQISSFNPSNCSFFSWLISLTRQTALEKVKAAQGTSLLYTSFVHDADSGERGEKSAFDLVYYKGLTYIEAASALEVTVGELKTHLKRTIESLKEKNVV